MRCGLRPNFVWINKVDPVLKNSLVNRILHKRGTVRYAPQSFEIRLIFGKEKFFGVFAIQMVTAKLMMRRFNYCRCGFSQAWFPSIPTPAPAIAKPNSRKEMKRGQLRPAVGRTRANQN